MAAEQIVVEYRAEIDGLKAQLKAVETSLKNVEKQGKESAANTAKSFEKAGDNVKQTALKMAGALGLAFGVATVINFGKELVSLASKAEGIKRSFVSLNNPKLLDDLRVATKGTVSDIELMKGAIKFNNFKLPLDQLAGLFKFASQRARETGESVDYLTESIVLGISRKSPLILDNLGISVASVNAEFKKTGDFAQAVGIIVNRELELMGDQALTSADKISRISAAYENIKSSAGDVLISMGSAFTNLFDDIENGFGTSADRIKRGELEAEFAKSNANIIDAARKSETQRLFLYDYSAKKLKELVKERGEEIIDEETGFFRERTNAENLFIDVQIRSQIKLSKTLLNLNKEKNDQLSDEQIKAAAELEKTLRDLRTSSIIDERQREKKALNDKFEDDKNAAISDASLIIKLRDKLNSDLIAIDKKYNDKAIEDKKKKIIENEKSEKELLESLKKLREDYDKFISQNDSKNDSEIKERVGNFFKIREDEASKLSSLLSDNSKGNRELELADLDLKYSEEQKKYKDNAGILLQLKIKYEKDIKAIEEDAAKNKRKILAEGLNLASEIISAINARTQGKADLEIQGINDVHDKNVKKLDEELRKKIITQEQYTKKKTALDEKQHDAEAKIKTKAFESEKKAKIVMAIISTAAGIVAQFEAGPAGFALAALAAATGAAQIAIIASQPTPKFAKGGLVGGKLHSEGGTLIEAQRGEYVSTIEATGQHRGLLEAMNKGKEQKYIQDFYIAPILRAQMKKQSELKDNSFASNIANSLALNSNFKDGNLLDSMKQSRRADKENIIYLAKVLSSNNGNKRNW